MWTWLKDVTFWIISWAYGFCGDWGLAIIIITVLFRLALYPVTAKQNKSSYQMQKLQPQIKVIQEKYAGDQQRMNAEMQKIYADNHYNPLAGCLPLLLQMPIFIILYQTLLEYIPQGATFYNLVPNLSIGCSSVWDSGIAASLPYIIMIILFAVTTFIPMIMQGNVEKQTMVMAAVMSIMMLWIGWSAPAGVMLFWITSSVIGIAQQKIIQDMMKKKDEEKEELATVVELKPVEVDVERKVRKPKPTKKR